MDVSSVLTLIKDQGTASNINNLAGKSEMVSLEEFREYSEYDTL